MFVEVVDLLEISLNLCLVRYFLDYVFGPHSEVKYLLDRLRGKLPELRRPEDELRHIFWLDTLVREVLLRPIDELHPV